MTDESIAAAPRPRRKPVFGPEPWREVAGRTWSHWDLWFCLVLVSDFDGDWAALAEELWRRRSPYPLTLDEEAKNSHLDDLRARLADAGLVVLTTPTKEASIRRLAVEFADRQATPCRRSSVTVFSVPSSSAVAGAVAGGWPVDDLSLGPRPAVWLPDATAEVERVNRRLSHKLESLGSIATSPVVLAVPSSAMARVGGGRKVPWRTMVAWARRTAPGSRLRIGRPDPTSSTAGLLATIALDAEAGRSATPDAQRHAVEQTVDPVADELSALCRLGQPGGRRRAP
jgi:hypothetical protein